MENQIQTIIDLAYEGTHPSSYAHLASGPVSGRIQVVEAQSKGDDWSIAAHDTHGWSPRLVETVRAPKLDPETDSAIWAHSLHRGAQVYLALREAVETGMGIQLCHKLPKSRQDLRANVEFLALLDLKDKLLPWIKETTSYVAAMGFAQSETNKSSLEALRAAVRDELLLGADFLLPTAERVLPAGKIRDVLRSVCSPRKAHAGPSPSGVRRLRSAQHVLFVKRGCPPAEPWAVEKAYKDHETALSQGRPSLARETPHGDTLEAVKVCIRQLVREVFKGKRFKPSATFPSMSACVERAATQGGGLMELWSHFRTRDSEASYKMPGSSLQKMMETPDGIIEVRSSDSVQMRLDDFIATSIASAKSYLGAVKGANGIVPGLPVLPYGICEPCKVRMITMGPASVYWCAKALQRFLWGAISDQAAFQWTASPIDEPTWGEEFDPQILSLLLSLDPSLVFVSGDYKGATDNLHPELCLAAADEICRFIRIEDGGALETQDWHDILKACLVGHWLCHAVTRADFARADGNVLLHPKGVPQQWGQLMGSPVSFPVLNLINLASTSVSLGWTPDAGSVLDFAKRFFIHTNGDDIAFVCNVETQYPRWKECVTMCGLAPSLGKNYTSREFLIINSEMRILHEVEGPLDQLAVEVGVDEETRTSNEKVDAPFDEVAVDERLQRYGWSVLAHERRATSWDFLPFLNLALLYGMEAKGPDAGKSVVAKTPFFETGSYARALCRQLDYDDATRARYMYRFVEYWDSAIKRAPAGVIWEAPQALGGLGFPSFRTTQRYPEQALKRCAYVACLDTKTRVKLVTPPKNRAGNSPWEETISRISTSGLEVERVSERTFFDQDKFVIAPRLQMAVDIGGKGNTLGEFLRSFDPNDFEPSCSHPADWITEGDATPGECTCCAMRRQFAAWARREMAKIATRRARQAQPDAFSFIVDAMMDLLHSVMPRDDGTDGVTFLETLLMNPTLWSCANAFFREQQKAGQPVPPWWRTGAMTDREHILSVRSVERRFAKRLSKVQALADASPLQPMKLSSLRDWADNRMWEIVYINPNYDCRLTRVDRDWSQSGQVSPTPGLLRDLAEDFPWLEQTQ